MRRQFRGRIALRCASALAAITVIVLGTPALALASTAGSGPGQVWVQVSGQPVQVIACPGPHGKPVPRKLVHVKPPGKGARIRVACAFPKGCLPRPAVTLNCRAGKRCPSQVAISRVCRSGKGCPPANVRLVCPFPKPFPKPLPKGCPSATLTFDVASGSSTLTEVSGPVLAPVEQFTYDGQTYTINTVNPGADSFTVFTDNALFVNNGPAITDGIGHMSCTPSSVQ